MICRIWHGWTAAASAARYEGILRGEVIPEIESRAIPGFQSIDVMRRAGSDGVEFTTIMWFESLDAVKAFAGDDYEVAHVPVKARSVLLKFDERSAHYEVLDRREQKTKET